MTLTPEQILTVRDALVAEYRSILAPCRGCGRKGRLASHDERRLDEIEDRVDVLDALYLTR